MGKLCHPVIVVPGITASYLRDMYPLPPDAAWTVLTKEYQRLTLHPDNRDYEAVEPARLVADQVYEIAYRELIEELRHNLSAGEDRPTPVYPFAYDWRRPLSRTRADLFAFIGEVIERTTLMRHYHDDGYGDDPKVHLVGHSMGGLVIAGCLAAHGDDARVAKVATLATPFRGSWEAVVKITTGTADLGAGDASSREREMARMTPALYHLLPAYTSTATGMNGGPGLAFFDPAAWQPSVVDTLTEFIRLRGVDAARSAAKRREQAAELFKTLLDEAAAYRMTVEGLHLADAGLTLNDWLCVVGVDSRTRIDVPNAGTVARPAFTISSDYRRNEWGNPNPALARLTGDGTVPFEGAVPAFIPEECLVCVSPGDFGYWEVQDRVTAATAGFHGILPNMDMLHRMIVRFFMDRPDRHGNTWGRRVPGVATWTPPLELTEKT